MSLVPLPNQAGANNFFRQGDLIDNSDRILARLDVRFSPTDSVFARYIYSQRDRQIPGAFGGVVDGTGTSAFGNQTIDTNALVAGWTRIFSPTVVNEFRFSWSQATSDAVQQPFGEAPPAAATIPGSITNPTVAGGLPGITIDGYFGGSGLGRIGSPDFLPKFQHTNQLEFINTLSWLRGSHALKFGFDVIAPMKNVYLDVPATRGCHALPEQLHRQPHGRLPARLRLRPSALERLGGGPAPLGHELLRPRRLEGDPGPVREPGLALRLHHPRPGGAERADELRPRGHGQPGLRLGRLPRGKGPREVRQEQLRAARRHRLQARRQDDGAGRLRHLLQPLRPRGQRGSARPQRARAHQQHGDPDLGLAGLLPPGRLSPRTS